MAIVKRCGNCGGRIEEHIPYKVKIGGRLVEVCGDCLVRVARGIATVDRLTRRAAA